MATDKITRCLGLVTQYNPLTAGTGALIRADNCVIQRENVVEDRRGYALYSTLSNSTTQLMSYLSRVLSHNGTTVSYDNGSGTFANYSGTYTAPTSSKMRFVEAFSNIYCTTDKGIQVFTDLAGTAARKAGAPRSLDGSYALSGGSGFLADQYQCAYRFVIKRTDANSNVLFGYPSTRMWSYNNTGGATSKNVDVTLYLPAEATTADTIQVYRTAQTSGIASDTAGDEMALVYQVSPAAADISNGYIVFTDSVTDALRGAALYTSPTQEGIGQANERPPLCKDVALYKSKYAFYANTSTKQRLTITLVGVGSLTGQTITLGGITYNFGVTEIISGGGSPQVLVTTGGAAASNIDATARSLVKVINRYASNTTVYAYYLSGPNDLPGQIMIEERGVGASAFTVQGSNTAIGTMFFPPPPVSPATSTVSTSTNQVQKNGLYFSKELQPEAVPLTNYLPVGPANKEILRIQPLRDSLIIIKEEGVYRLTGENPQSFTVTLLDNTVFCKASSSVVTLANQVFMLSSQGVVAISDNGVQVVSRSIEPDVKPLASFSNTATYSVGVAYESDRSYMLSTVSASTDTATTQTFVYNVFTQAWTKWTFGFNAAIVEPTADKLYFSKASTPLYRERKDFVDADYSDPETAVTIASISGKVVVITSSVEPQPGWMILQGTTQIPISSVVTSASSYSCTMRDTLPDSWIAGAATLYPSVGMWAVWDAWSGQQGAGIGELKQVSEFAVFSDPIPGNNTATTVTPTFYTNLDQSSEEVNIYPPSGGWGASWGTIPWGGSGDTFGYRTFVPRNKQFCHTMNPGVKHINAMEKLALCGCGFLFEPKSTRISR